MLRATMIKNSGRYSDFVGAEIKLTQQIADAIKDGDKSTVFNIDTYFHEPSDRNAYIDTLERAGYYVEFMQDPQYGMPLPYVRIKW